MHHKYLISLVGVVVGAIVGLHPLITGTHGNSTPLCGKHAPYWLTASGAPLCRHVHICTHPCTHVRSPTHVQNTCRTRARARAHTNA